MGREVVIASAVRTPIGKFQGSFSNIPAPKLASIAIKEAVKRAALKNDEVDEVIMGNALSAGIGQAPARQASIFAGLGENVNCVTVNKVCASGLKAVSMGAQAIKTNDANIVIAGGMENMSLSPYLLEKARTGYKLGNAKVIDSMVKDGLWDVYNNFHMGITAELVAEKYNISKEEQDEFALSSYKKAIDATDNGYFKEEIVGIEIKEKKETKIINEDEEPKSVNLEKLPTLKPAFKENGTVTAGNASKINDGASALVLMSEEEAKKRGVTPLAKIIDFAQSAVDPKWVMLAPVYGILNVLKKSGFSKEDIDLFEINEAFSAASLAVIKETGIPKEKLNVLVEQLH